MPKWCANELHATGSPERVDEFRILHGQHISPTPIVSASGDWRTPENHPQRFPSHALVADRHPNNLSLTSACPVEPATDIWAIKEAWGTTRDIESEVRPMDPQFDRSPLRLPHGLAMSRSHSVRFDTAWTPADSWFTSMAPKFPDLCLTLGYEGQDNRDYGYCSSDPDGIGHETFDQRGRGLSGAKQVAREHMPKKTKPGKLVSAIYADDVATTIKHLEQCDENGLVDGLWAPLMYAAKTGSEKVFEALLAKGHDLTWKAESGIGIIDMLMDVYPNNPVALVEARYAMLAKTFEKNPSLASAALASGITPAEMAIRFSMPPVLENLHIHGALDAKGRMGGWLAVATETSTSRIIDNLGDHIPEAKHDQFYSAVALRAASESNIDLLRAVYERFKDFAPTIHAQLRGEMLLPGQKIKASDEFVHAYNSLLANQAIARVMATAKAGLGQSSVDLRP